MHDSAVDRQLVLLLGTQRQTDGKSVRVPGLAEIHGHAHRPWLCKLTEENDSEWKIWKIQEGMEN
jgi:hypothetical protein